MDQQGIRNLGWRVTLAGMGINLALGVLYSWSVIKQAIPKTWGWSDFDKTLPYSLACLVFAATMVPAGRVQDRYGPRWVALAGGIAVGLGLIFASFVPTVPGFAIGFGVLAGAGFGMGYAAATPAAVKWFPPRRTGQIAGLVVAGFGLASVYISPLAKYLIAHFSVATKTGPDTGPGLQKMLLILGAAFLVIVGLLSQLLTVPPAGWKAPDAAMPPGTAGAAKARKPSANYTWRQMLAMPQFYLLWVMYLFAAGAGLMIIASLASIVKLQAGTGAGFLFVALLAVGNAAGRIAAGSLSDKIGRRATMMIVFLIQAAVMFTLPGVTRLWTLAFLSVLLGANYGANLALFPAATKDYFGLPNFGVNYGLVFTAWGVGAVVLAQVSGLIYDATRSYNLAYTLAGAGLLGAAALALFLKAPAPSAARTEADLPLQLPAPVVVESE